MGPFTSRWDMMVYSRLKRLPLSVCPVSILCTDALRSVGPFFLHLEVNLNFLYMCIYKIYISTLIKYRRMYVCISRYTYPGLRNAHLNIFTAWITGLQERQEFVLKNQSWQCCSACFVGQLLKRPSEPQYRVCTWIFNNLLLEIESHEPIVETWVICSVEWLKGDKINSTRKKK